MNSAIEVYARDADWTCAAWKQIFCIVWRGNATAARARIALSSIDSFLAKGNGRVGGFVVVEPGSAPPESDVRPVFATMMRKAGDRMVGLAYFVSGEGFKSAIVRGTITGLSLLARESYPTQVFTNVDESIQWLGTRLYGQTHFPGFVSDAEMVVKSLREGHRIA